MKKTILSLALFALSLVSFAQVPTLEAQSVYDVDQDNKVNVEDIKSTVKKVAEQVISDKVNVETEKMNLVLDAIYTRLLYIEAKLGLTSISHDYVDLELPSGTLWATCNVGAEKPHETGYYFAWGETTEGDKIYNWSSYKWANGADTKLTKYCMTDYYWGGDEGKKDEVGLLSATDDAATANWGTDWRMPTAYQVVELFNPENTTSVWTEQNGVAGRLITSVRNSKSIFLPVSGYVVDTAKKSDNAGIYWTRTLSPESNCADYLFFNETNPFSLQEAGGNRCLGMPVRPVRTGIE